MFKIVFNLILGISFIVFQENQPPNNVVWENVSRSVHVQRIPRTAKEDTTLVQFVSLYKDKQETDSVWPEMKSCHQYWTKAAKFIQESVGSALARKGIVR